MSAPSRVSIPDLVGVWRRASIRWPDGREDTTTTVYWLQGRRYFADIRIPAGRPSFDGVTSFDECSSKQRDWLATQEGFAGELIPHGDDAVQWLRDIDYRPPGGPPDIGRLRFVDASQDQMIEEGVVQPYVEVWERVDRGEPLVLRLDEGDGERRWFIGVGRHFILASGSRSGVEISHGGRDGESEPVVTLSTSPWREGTPTFKPVHHRSWRMLEPAGSDQNITAPPLGLRHWPV